MGGPDDHVSTFDDWAAPSPSPRTFFSSILADDMNTTSMLENNNELFPGLSEGNLNGNNGEPNGGLVEGESRRADIYSQQKMNSRGGLVERMAARTGFDAPKLNTGDVRPTGFSQNKDARSPYLTIPPGLSPTTLLESPVFLSNALAQPSPTTGKFPFTFGGFDTRCFSSNQEGPNKYRENIYGDINTSSFAFKAVPDSGTSSFLGPTSNNFPGFEVSKGLVVSSENSSPPDDEQDEEGEQPSGGDPLPGVTAPAEDGYNWRKYGQKQVKGSEYPRSYYKCTHPNCPVKKKVERSQEGHITEIIYKGAHSHPKPPPNRRSGVTMLSDAQDNSLEVTSSESVEAENLLKSEDVVDDGDEDDRVTHGSVSLGCDGEEDESESKRRKIEAYTAADMSGATRAIREPRVVVQTTSEVDILDDGYRWRKYGQKVVKGNPNPRSYYKCTHTGCAVRKHVERASHDLKSVITTYEGKHNHEVPAARNTTSHQSNTPNGLAHLPAQFQRHDSAQLQSAMARFDNRNNLVMGSFGMQQQLGPSHGLGYGMGQPAFANLAMAGMGPERSNNTYMEQQQIYNEMGFMLPKGEPKVEPFAEAPMNLQNGSSGYHPMISRLPLGP